MITAKAYKKLTNHFKEIGQTPIIEFFNQDKSRAKNFTLDFNGLTFDFSKNNITQQTVQYLVDLANESNLDEQIKAMFSGEPINNTEQRSVLHTALRAPENTDTRHCEQSEVIPLYEKSPLMINGQNVTKAIHDVLRHMQSFSQQVHNGTFLGYSGKKITDIVNIGIGGSDLGPHLICEALKPYRQNKLNVHFISNVDGYELYDKLVDLNPETTLFVIASKTFTTQETMTNAESVRTWFLEHAKEEQYIKQHFVAVSTNIKAVVDFGIDKNNIFEFWDFVGGRYSSWSAIGLSIVLYIGFENFKQLLDGARAMDQHFYETTDYTQNLPVMLALISLWYINFFNYKTTVISPYNARLSRFPAYIQQLEMESNGKSVDKNGMWLNYDTCPVIWGGSGINGQHAYYQLLHQGTSICPMDIIIALSEPHSNKTHQDILVSNAFAQAEAFMCGKDQQSSTDKLIRSGMNQSEALKLAAHKIFPGNRPTNMLLLPEITPYYLGMLIALYEHKTFTQGVIWNINSFDQMGVELGKELAQTILHDINSHEVTVHDSSTTSLIKHYLNL